MELIAYRNILRVTSRLTYILLFSHSAAFAVNYSFPSDFPPQTVPFSLSNNDTLTVTSGTMATANGNATGYTVNFSAATTGNITITVNNGATVSYNGDNGAAAAIFSTRNSAAATTNNININGTVQSGTGLYALSFANTIGVTAADTYNINISGTATISGTILTSGVQHSTVNITGTPTINGVIALATSSVGSSSLIVGATGTASFTPTFALSDIAFTQIANNSSLTIGVTNSDLTSILIDSGSTLTTTSTLVGSSVDGALVNNGTFNIGAAIAKTGTFTGSGTNVVSAGSATGIEIDTSNYQVANHTAVLLDVQNYGNITLSTANFNLNNGGANSFNVAYGTDDGYSPGYFPSGTYTLVTTTAGAITAPTIGAMPTNTMFLTFGTPTVNGNTIQITLTRTPFNSYASTALTQNIGNNLEIIGDSDPSNSMISLLNAVEASTSNGALQSALQQLAPLTTAPIFGYQIQNDSMRQAQLRLAEVRNHNGSYIAGDIGRDSYIWLRPFGAYANQDPKDDSLGYYARSGGLIAGFDRNLDDYYTLGAAFAYINSNIQDKINALSTTNLRSYVAMAYGSYNFTSTRYLDWVLAFTANHFAGNRIIDFNSFNQFATSAYNSQQFAVNGIFAQDYDAFGFMQLTPEFFAQYTYCKQYPYTEDNAGGANLEIIRPNANIVSLGVGGKAAIPLLADPSIIIPEIHGMFFYNPLIGNQNTTFSFVDGGGPMLSTFTLSRTGLLLGAAFTLAVVDRLELKFNFDYDIEDRFHGYTAWLNLRYVF